MHVDDFLCSGEAGNLEWLYQSLRKRYDLSRTMVGSEFEQECKYLNRIVRWTDRGFEIEGDPKHVNLLLKEWGMEQCSLVDTPITKEGQDQAGSGEELKEEEARTLKVQAERLMIGMLEKILAIEEQMEVVVDDGEDKTGQRVILSRRFAAYEQYSQYTGWIGVLQQRVSPGIWKVHFPAMHYESTIELPIATHNSALRNPLVIFTLPK